eukprot:GHVU01064776.1.p1 GENE.GHVU01064776.1~~GHVU01064776.1.p1  ORF type:complete len:225 (+),score=45.67 GHVU01064776.1:89-763(+)
MGRVVLQDVETHLGLPLTPPRFVAHELHSVVAPAPAPAAAARPLASAPASSGTPSAGAAGRAVPASGVAPLDAMQKAIARNMEATLNTPVFRVSREIPVDKLEALLAQLKPKGMSMSALLAKATAITLADHPGVNAAYTHEGGGATEHPGAVNVAMAVGTEGGLVTPVLRDADRKDVYSLAREWKELVNKAQTKKLKPDDYSGGGCSGLYSLYSRQRDRPRTNE